MLLIGLIITMSVVIQPPSPGTIDNLKQRTIDSTYNKVFNGHRIKYGINDIIKLLNKIDEDTNIPEGIRFAWGDGLLSLSAAKEAVHNIGT